MTTISTKGDMITLINVFTVEPTNRRRLRRNPSTPAADVAYGIVDD